MSKLRLAALALVGASLLSASSASAQNFMFEANLAKAEGLEGAELGVGYSLTLDRFRITPVVGALIYQGDNDRYREETLSNGNRICRDTRNGQFAKKEKCDNTAAEPYGKLEAAVRLGETVEFGGGVRVSDEARPYGLIGFKATEQFVIQGFVGEKYYGAGLRLRF